MDNGTFEMKVGQLQTLLIEVDHELERRGGKQTLPTRIMIEDLLEELSDLDENIFSRSRDSAG